MDSESDYQGLEILLRGFGKLDKTKLELGVVGPKAEEPSPDGKLKMWEVAIINEFGSKDMHIPARHFMTGSITVKDADAAAVKVLDQVIAGKDADSALASVGAQMVEKIRDRIYRGNMGALQGDFKPNAPSTVNKKGFNHPLLDTSKLADSISFHLTREGGDTVDAGAAGQPYESFEVTGGE